jgi:hypothetical protein
MTYFVVKVPFDVYEEMGALAQYVAHILHALEGIKINRALLQATKLSFIFAIIIFFVIITLFCKFMKQNKTILSKNKTTKLPYTGIVQVCGRARPNHIISYRRIDIGVRELYAYDVQQAGGLV